MDRLSTNLRLLVYNWRENARLRWAPGACVLCRAAAPPGRDLCAGCLGDLPRPGAGCARCALPLPVAPEAHLCGRCIRRPPAFDRVVAAFEYAGPVAWLVQQMKFRRRLALATLLGGLLAERVAADLAIAPECLVPVPMHPARLRARGFNQALELARPVARRLRIPVERRLCRRVRHTRPQSSLPLAERGPNVRGAFAAAAGAAPQHVAIVDDVVTSAGTVDELARALRGAGARRIEVWTLARAVPHH